MSQPSQESAQASQCMPSEENLSALLHKLLTVFGTEAVISGQPLPEYPLQRELWQTEGRDLLKRMSDMPGNDFPDDLTSPTWDAFLRLGDGEDAITVKLARLMPHMDPEKDEGQEEVRVQQAAQLLRLRWPNASDSPSRENWTYESTGTHSPSFQLMRWIHAKEVNPRRELVTVKELGILDGALLLRPRQRRQEEVMDPDTTGTLSQPMADAHFWSFCGPDFEWIISLPFLAATLLLMANPSKINKERPPTANPDRDLAWSLSALENYCSLRTPDERGAKSWSFGTYPGHWMHLHCVVDYLRPTCHLDVPLSEWVGNGIPVHRRTFGVPIGPPDNESRFRTYRVWIAVRTATSYDGVSADRLPAPTTAGFIIADQTHFCLRIGHRHLRESKLNAVPAARGVVFFQMVIWNVVNDWKFAWDTCLNTLESYGKIKLEDLHDTAKIEREWMRDDSGRHSREYFVAGHVLANFREEIGVLPRQLHGMQSDWEFAYPPYDDPARISKHMRFSLSERQLLTENWEKLVAHVDELHNVLLGRIEKRVQALGQLRNNILLERLYAQKNMNQATYQG